MKEGSLVGERYELVRKLGVGAFKEVWLARDVLLHRDVALAFLVRRDALTPSGLNQLRREASALAQFKHPNVVAVYNLVEDSSPPYLVTEYVGGGSLKELLAQTEGGHADLQWTLAVMLEVAEALVALHARALFHRDIKPSNILIDTDGTAKLGDFGLAEPVGTAPVGEAGAILGTPRYMSPEQVKGRPADAAADLYSFGVTLFEAVTGRCPFNGDDASIIVMHLETPPPDPTQLRIDCPDPLRDLVLALLAKSPHERPGATATVDALRSLLICADSSARLESDDPAPATARQRWSRIGGITGALIATLGLVTWALLPAPISLEAACRADRAWTYPITDAPAPAWLVSAWTDRQDVVEAALRAANPALFEHLIDVRGARYREPPGRYLTYVWGPPAVGKSAVARWTGPKHDPSRCLIKLSEYPFTAERIDLAPLDGSVQFNALPSASPGQFSLDALLEANACVTEEGLVPFVVIDDLDEIHPETAALVLRSLDQLVLDDARNRDALLSITLFGRPESFSEWFKHPARRGAAIAQYLKTFSLEGPTYSTAGAVETFVLDRCRFLGLACPGVPKAYLQSIRQHPYLSYSIRSLPLSTSLLHRKDAGGGDSEATLKEFLFRKLLSRNQQTHGRPGPEHALYREYRDLLEGVAVKYAAAGTTDGLGYFDVSADDVVPTGLDRPVSVSSVLARSGLATLEPRGHAADTRFRFEPAWVHAHLIEGFNVRTVPGYTYRGCYQ